MVRRCPALAISDTVHVVSIDRVDERDNPESGEAEDRRSFFDCVWDDGVVSPSILSGLTDGVLLPLRAKQNFLIFTICLHEQV
jgi:hypothetical protein